MGFGTCSHNRPSVRLLTPNTNNGPRNLIVERKTKHECPSFYWDITSVMLKTFCLASFFVIESPRRVVSYVTRKPEPTPRFICAKWGYRMCACGHHYYEHNDVDSSKLVFPEEEDQVQPEADTPKEAPASIPAEKSSKSRFRLWPFTRK